MIVLEEMSWFNMFGYGPNNRIRFNKDQITQLIGTNGQGKTTIVLILQELLFSKNIKGIKKTDIKNRYVSSTEWGGEVIFTSNNIRYIVNVYRKGATTKVKLTENGKDISEHKVPDTYKKLKEILGDFEIVCLMTYQSSTDLLEFLKATDTSRKNFLISFFNLMKYVNIGETVKVILSGIEKEYLTKQGELNSALSFLSETVIPNKLEQIKVTEIDESLIAKKQELETSIHVHDDLCKKIDRNNLFIKERDSLKFDMGLERPDMELYERLAKDIKEASEKVAIINQQKLDKEKSLKNLNLAAECYVCKQPIDNSQAISVKTALESEISAKTHELTANKTTLVGLETRYEMLKKEILEYSENKRKIERFEQLMQLIDSRLQTNYPDFSEITKQYQSVSETIKLLKTQREKDLKYNESVAINNTKVDAYTEQKRNYLAKKEILEGEIAALKTRVTRLNILKKAFSTTGLVAFKLENLTKALEETINNYLAELSDGQFQVIFRLEGEKLNIIVRNEGEESPIESLSGGEFGRVQTAILLAIRNVLTKIGGNSINLLFLDEIDGTLDAVGKEKLIEVLRNERNLNVFLISHSFNHPLIERIEVKKEGNISQILN